MSLANIVCALDVLNSLFFCARQNMNERKELDFEMHNNIKHKTREICFSSTANWNYIQIICNKFTNLK